MVLSAVTAALRKGDVNRGIQFLREWLRTANPGDTEDLVATCPVSVRPGLITLLRDLLSRYPHTMLGAPVLLFIDQNDSDPSPYFEMPIPNKKKKPCTDLEFIGWLPRHSQLPVTLPFQQGRYDIRMPFRTCHASVALFLSHPAVFDLDELIVPNPWWGDLFRGPGHVHMSSHLLLPYPDALESANVQYAAATNTPAPEPKGWLSEEMTEWSKSSGAVFQETCRHYFF